MSNTIIAAHIVDQTVQLANLPLLASGSVGVVQIQCDFCSRWDGYGKTAVFYKKADKVFHIPLVDNLVTVPHEMLAEEGSFYFGVMGAADNTRTTEVLKVKVVQGAITVSTAAAEEITPNIYEQLLMAYGVAEARLDQVVAMRSAEGATVFTMTAEYLEGTITTNGAAAFVECLPTFQLAAGEYANFYIPEYLAPMVPVEISYANADITVTVRIEDSTGKPMLSFYNGSGGSIKLATIPAIGSYSLASVSISELGDARVGYNGKTYDSAGAAVRGQISTLAGDIKAIAIVDRPNSVLDFSEENFYNISSSYASPSVTFNGDGFEFTRGQEGNYNIVFVFPTEVGKTYDMSFNFESGAMLEGSITANLNYPNPPTYVPMDAVVSLSTDNGVHNYSFTATGSEMLLSFKVKYNSPLFKVSDAFCVLSNAAAKTKIREEVLPEYLGVISQTTKRVLASASEWENQIFQSGTGDLAIGNTCLVSKGYQQNLHSAACADGYVFVVCCYDANKTYMGTWSGSKIYMYANNLTSADFSDIYATTSAEYFKIYIKRNDGAAIDLSERSALTVLANTSELEENLLDEIENVTADFSGSVTKEDVQIVKSIPFKSCFRASYKFPKDIHSTSGEYELFNLQSGLHNISVKFAKAVTTAGTEVPFSPVPVYNAGFKVYRNEELVGTLIPDGWRKELLLGDDPMSIRFKGDCTKTANQDIRLKVDADNIVIYHSNNNSVIASFAKSQYATLRALYDALLSATAGSLAEFEVYPLGLEHLAPSDIIECDIPLVGRYYDSESRTSTRYDAFPYYFTTKQSDKVYDVEMLFNKGIEYPIQILVNGCAVAKFNKISAEVQSAFTLPNTFTVRGQRESGILVDGVEFDGTRDLSKYPDIKVLTVEKIDAGLESLQPGYSVSLNKVLGWAALAKSKGRQYIGMKDIERMMDGSIKASSNYLWNFQLDDSSIECVTDADVRNALLRNNIRPSIAMMLNKPISDKDLKIVKASESAGFEYHVHTCYTDGNISIAYYTYNQLHANVTEAIEKFIEIYGSVPTVWGKHSGVMHYSVSRYLKNKGIRIIFSDQGEGVSLNEITRFACKRNLIQESSAYTALLYLDKTYC